LERTTGLEARNRAAVIDYRNTSGLATGKTPLMVAFWASTDNNRQCISYSNDKGRTWAKYSGNPILVHPSRDPKVFWYEPGSKWIMLLYGPPGNSYLLFESKNLLSWESVGEPIPDMYECPDMFPLPLDGDRAREKWVIVDGAGAYQIGAFDGTPFRPETKKQPSDYGRNFYATMTWVGMPERDGRRIQVAWMRGGSYPDMPFNQQISFPAELTLHTVPEGVRLYRRPVREIAKLYRDTFALRDTILKPGENPFGHLQGDLFDVAVEIDLSKSSSDQIVIGARGNAIKYLAKDRVIESCGVRTAMKPRSGRVTLRVLVDRMSIETFGNDGEVSITNVAGPVPSRTPLSLQSIGGNTYISSVRVHRLQSIWPK